MAQRSTKRADGRLVRAITDPRTGKRKYFYGTTEREINAQIMEYTAKIENGILTVIMKKRPETQPKKIEIL